MTAPAAPEFYASPTSAPLAKRYTPTRTRKVHWIDPDTSRPICNSRHLAIYASNYYSTPVTCKTCLRLRSGFNKLDAQSHNELL